jgi:hypothetical protein
MPSRAERSASIGGAASVLNGEAADTARQTSRYSLVLLFGAGLWCGAVLMFLVEPMAAKMVLPHLGGAPAVWNTCVVFFQATLLAGYAYAHVAPRSLGLRRHAIVHVALLLASLLALPSALRIGTPAGNSNPVVWLLLQLSLTLGLPFFLLASTAPLMQRWFSRTTHEAASDPYFLYAASNFGSLVGLLLYPAVLEPLLPLREQALFWKYGYVAYALLVSACVMPLLRRLDDRTAERQMPSLASGPSISQIGWPRRLRWIALSFAPSSLMLAVTTFISTDIAAVPLLWVLPLALYLVTFVIAFSSSSRYPRGLIDRALPLLLLPLVLFLVLRIGGPLALVVPLHLGVFFIAALLCHRALADDRPDAVHLTEFYLLVSVGGVLGSTFNTLVAPLLFTGILEYPAVLVLVCLLRDVTGAAKVGRRWRVAAPILCGVILTAITLSTAHLSSLSVRFALMSVPTFFCLSVSRTRLPFAAAIGAMLLVSILQWDELGKVQYAQRTFFGAYKVRLEPDGSHRTLSHGTTLHGIQSVARTAPAEPLSYYHRTGPLGDVFDLVPSASRRPHIGVVGLGVGSVAAYRKPSQTWTFFEIDPEVERIARRTEFFTFLQECGPPCRVVIGDARQSLAVDRNQYGVLVLDAFSSDAIPIHLVTREAIRLYLERLAPDGVLAFHISNRHLNLEPVLARIAEEERLVSMIRRDRIVATESSGKTSSDWLVMARARGDLGGLASNRTWTPSQSSLRIGLWTDDFSNVLTLLLRQ